MSWYSVSWHAKLGYREELNFSSRQQRLGNFAREVRAPILNITTRIVTVLITMIVTVIVSYNGNYYTFIVIRRQP